MKGPVRGHSILRLACVSSNSRKMPRPDSPRLLLLLLLAGLSCPGIQLRGGLAATKRGALFSTSTRPIWPWRLSLNSEPYGIPRKSNADITQTERSRAVESSRPDLRWFNKVSVYLPAQWPLASTASTTSIRDFATAPREPTRCLCTIFLVSL